jgi:monovalent cation:H+ antiporter-2, CPA2 family
VQTIDWFEYREGLIFLLTAGVVAPLFRRMRLSPVLGFLLAGAVLGPSGLGRLAARVPWVAYFALPDLRRIAGLADFGVVFLLFMIGLELSFERVARLKRLVFGLGSLQVGACALTIGACAVAAGQSLAAAAAIGAALSLSSTAIVVPTLADRKRLGTTAGRTAFSVLLFQDLMVAPFLFAESVLGAPTHGDLALGLSWAIASAAMTLGALVLVGRLILRPMFHFVARAHSTEFFVAACLLVVVVSGLAAAAAGLSMSLGAFVAGLLLAETEFRREIEVTIEPFKGLLLGLFFVSVGASLDLGRLLIDPARILGLAAGLVALKAVLVDLAARPFGLSKSVRLHLGLLLGPGGEFAFVMLTGATAAKVIPAGVGADVAIAVTLSMAAIPFLASLAVGISPPRPDRDVEAERIAPPTELSGHVLIIGYGRVGRLVADMVVRNGLAYLAVDRDSTLVGRERRAGGPIYFGDATRPEFLRRCGIAGAKAVIVTMDNPHAAEETVVAARCERSDLTIVARARDPHQAQRLYELGATDAVPETIEASLQLSEAALIDLGVPMGLVIASIHEKRDEFRKLLQAPDRERRGVRLSTRMKNMSKSKRPEGSGA